MPSPIETPDQAFAALADPGDPNWGVAFALLASQPETARIMLETFAETLEAMGLTPSGTDPATGQPTFSIEEVASALGIPASDQSWLQSP